MRHDFEYWAAACVTVKDKLTGRDVKFMLNRPQRRVVALLEEQRCAGLPPELGGIGVEHLGVYASYRGCHVLDMSTDDI